MLPAVILAAGESRRMGRPKAVLAAPDGRPFITRIVDVLSESADEIVVVTGIHHDAIAEALERTPARRPLRLVRNPDPARGQLSSLWIGMDAAVTPAADGLMMTLVDVPTILPATVAAVVEAWRRTRAPIVRPARGDRHGHPVIFDRAVFDELRATPLALGAKAVVHAHLDALVDVAVADEGCLVDVDTPDDYRRLIS